MRAPRNDKYLDKKLPVLDHGFVCLQDYMGDDAAIAAAARCSMAGEGTKQVSDDERLIRRLMRDKHTSPFEMCELKFLCQMPIFVARQWIRHRTANVNEMSGRYGELPELVYVPEPSRVAYQSPVNKQGSGKYASEEVAGEFEDRLKELYTEQFDAYHEFLGHDSDEDLMFNFSQESFDEVQKNGGISRELARIHLPVATYTKWVWKIDLHNLLHFLRLRLDPHAQYEIRVYADAMAEIVKEMFPITWKAFEDFQLNSLTLSGPELEGINYYARSVNLSGTEPQFSSKSELDEFHKKMKLLGFEDRRNYLAD